jgi:hypothetical protein
MSGKFAKCCLIGVLLAFAAQPAGADDAATRRARLLCSILGEDLTEPGGLAAFRRCLAAHDPLAEAARPNNVGGYGSGRPLILDRPRAAPPHGFGRDNRASLAQAIQSFQTTDGKVIYAVATDGRFWRSTTGTKDAHVVDKAVAKFAVTRDDRVFVLSSDDALWREGNPRALIDQNVGDFQPLDAGNIVYVRGTNGRLWREFGTMSNRKPVDNQVAAFQAVDANLVFVLSTDGKLWRETGDANNRKNVAGSIKAFQYVPDGDTVYVLTTADQLWRQMGTQKPELVDHDVAAFHAADMNLVYVVARDGRLWKELGNRDSAVLVDRGVAANAGGFQIVNAGQLVVLGDDHKLWSETMPPGR